MNDSDYLQLPEGERQYFLRCDGCGDYFDKRQIEQVFFHIINDHKGKLNILQQGEGIE